MPHLLGGRPVAQDWILPYTVENYSHEDEITGMRFATGPEEIEVQVLCIACAAADAPDGRFATITDVDRAAIRGTCWLNTCRLANYRGANGNEFPACGRKDKSPAEGGCSLKHVNNLSPIQNMLSKASYEKRSQVMSEKEQRRNDPSGVGPLKFAGHALKCDVEKVSATHKQLTKLVTRKKLRKQLAGLSC